LRDIEEAVSLSSWDGVNFHLQEVKTPIWLAAFKCALSLGLIVEVTGMKHTKIRLSKLFQGV
jgi:hypothetical protein